MFGQLAVDDFLCGRDDGVADLGVEACKRHVGAGRCLLDDAERANDRGGLLFPADLEVAERALRLRAPIAIGLNFNGSKCIGFRACGCHQSCLFPRVPPPKRRLRPPCAADI
ncbi:hypothetical protein D3C72_1494650 [compost metagenome]